VAGGNDPDAWQADAVETWLFVQSTHRHREDNLIATTSYDAASRRKSSTSPMGNTQTLAYDVKRDVHLLGEGKNMRIKSRLGNNCLVHLVAW
jgi:YD repeat-containing protein